jgi:succinate dehydrogenase / fumarate reductase, cytochrome b subunit
MSEAVKEVPKKERREFRNIHITELPNYRLPPAGWVSILHRVSGAGLFLMLPFLLYLFDLSLNSESTYELFRSKLQNHFIKLILLGLIWAYMQHFCAGVRHLFMDVHLAIEKDSSRQSAIAVLAVSLFLTFVAGLKLFGVF